MSKYKFSQVQLFKRAYLSEGVYLVLLNALKVPPHLLLVVSGKVFSISTLGPSLDEDMEKYMRLIEKNRMATVFVKLSLPQLFTQADLFSKVRAVTRSYPRVDVGLATCLSPIADFCTDVYAVNKSQIHLVFDLLDELKNKDAVEGYYHMNLDDQLREGEVLVNQYSVFEVNEAIHAVR